MGAADLIPLSQMAATLVLEEESRHGFTLEPGMQPLQRLLGGFLVSSAV